MSLGETLQKLATEAKKKVNGNKTKCIKIDWSNRTNKGENGDRKLQI